MFSIPPDKVAKRVVVLNALGEEEKSYSIPEDNIQQLTINLPRFYNIDTTEMCQVKLPPPSSIWTGLGSNVFPMPLPPPPPSCSGFVPDCASGALPESNNIGDDIFDDDITPTEGQIDP